MNILQALAHAGVQAKLAAPNTSLRANYNDVGFNMNNYLVEITPIGEDLGKDSIEKYADDSPADKAFNKLLLTRQKKPEVIEPPALATNTNDNLSFLVTG